MRPIFLLIFAFVSLGARAFEFNVTVVWQNQGGNNPYFSANSIAEDGRIVGGYQSNADSRTLRAAIWSEGQIRTFEGFGYRSFGAMINRAGVMVGSASDSTEIPHTATWQPDGTFQTIGIRASGGRAITDGGTILAETYSRYSRSFVWRDGVRTDIPVFDERNESHAVDMNGSEIVVGYDFKPEGGGVLPWLWDASNGLRRIPDMLPYAINHDGVVAGTAFIWDRNYAVAYEGGVRRILNGGTTAYAVNNAGVFVGENGWFGGGVIWRGYRWAEKLTELIDPASGFEIRQAFGVNDSGQILAYATRSGQGDCTVRLDPVPRPWARRWR